MIIIIWRRGLLFRETSVSRRLTDKTITRTQLRHCSKIYTQPPTHTHIYIYLCVCACVYLITVRFRAIRRFPIVIISLATAMCIYQTLDVHRGHRGYINILIHVESCGGGGGSTSESFEGRNPFQLGTRIYIHILYMPFVINIHQLRFTLVVYNIYTHVYLFIVHGERRTNAFD